MVAEETRARHEALAFDEDEPPLGIHRHMPLARRTGERMRISSRQGEVRSRSPVTTEKAARMRAACDPFPGKRAPRKPPEPRALSPADLGSRESYFPNSRERPLGGDPKCRR